MGNWLTELRLKAGYKSIRSLSAESKVDVSTLSRIEKGVHIASPDTLKRLAPYLGTPYVKLLGITGHLHDDAETLELAELYRNTLAANTAPLAPVAPKNSSLEEDWPEVAQVLRSVGSLATVEERKRIARIIRATLAEEEIEGK